MPRPLVTSMPGGAEWIIITIIALLLFSPQLPQLGQALRDAIEEFIRRLKR